MKKNLVLLFFIFCLQVGYAQQTRHIVQFKNKAFTTFGLSNPSAFLSTKALARRSRFGIAIDSTDLPVTQRYIDSVRLAGNVEILVVSKWLNQVSIKTTDAIALAKINAFPFVQSLQTVANITANPSPAPASAKFGSQDGTIANNNTTAAKNANDSYNYGVANGQVNIHNGKFLHNLGFRGNGMEVAVMDAGFLNYLTLPTFDSLRLQNRITQVYDFVAKETSVNEDNSHGMQCLSTMAANIPGVFVGTAPNAKYSLFRTEDVATETLIEEHYLAAGYERADSLGIDLISVSLGYNTFDFASQNHTYADMDGNTTMAAIATDLAAKKGMLPVVAAGNEGNRPWRYIMTPGDADSALTVGAVDSLGNIGTFSSWGPASNGRVKPNVAAVGWRAIIANTTTGLPQFGTGTSFATPNMAGLATCLWQAFPEVNNMAIINALQKAGSSANAPNDRIGYGIPNVKFAFAMLHKAGFSKKVTQSVCNVTVDFTVKTGANFTIIVDRKFANQSGYNSFKTFTGTGNFSKIDLSFTDDLAANNVTSYLIKSSINGDTTYALDTIEVVANDYCKPSNKEYKIIENPVTSTIDLLINKSANADIDAVVISPSGHQVLQKKITHKAVVSLHTIAVQQLLNGLYYLKIVANGKTLTTIPFLKR
jgi:serine protease AprX